MRGDNNTFLLVHSLVVRQAYILELHKSADARMLFTQRETRARLWWAIYCLDRKVAVYNRDIPPQVPCHSFPVLLPIADSHFNSVVHPVASDSERSVRGHMIVLMGIYGRIIDSKNNAPNLYSTRILEESLLDWYSIVRHIIIDISLEDERLTSYDDWLKIFTKAMYHEAYIFLYQEEFGRICQSAVLSEIQVKIFGTCILSASSIAEISKVMYRRNPKSLYIDPFIDFCLNGAASLYLMLRNSEHHSNYFSLDNVNSLLNALKVKSKFSKFSEAMLRSISDT